MDNLTIGISTYNKRFESLKHLVNQVRMRCDNQIIIAVNGNHNEPFDEQYRKELLLFTANVSNCFVIMFTEFRSLSKLWNEIVIHSSNEYVYLLNDDLEFHNSSVFHVIEKMINEGNELFMCPINSWSHFVISKTLLDTLGYFDERLLGIGEEDGDIEWRYIERFHERVKGVALHGIFNKGEYEHKPNMNVYTQNKSTFNHEFIYNEKYHKSKHGIKGMFDYEMIQRLPNEKQYPYESFFRANKSKL
jgi:hypothetical protein